MKWEDFVMGKAEYCATVKLYNNAKPTNIDCPKCGKKILCRTDMVLTTNPPKHSYFCECGWSGTA